MGRYRPPAQKKSPYITARGFESLRREDGSVGPDRLGFGNCSNERECEAECPKEISITNIARLNREFFAAGVFSAQA